MDEEERERRVREHLTNAASYERAVRLLREQQRVYVVAARERGASWRRIGDALGVERTTALRRYRNLAGSP